MVQALRDGRRQRTPGREREHRHSSSLHQASDQIPVEVQQDTPIRPLYWRGRTVGVVEQKASRRLYECYHTTI